MDTVGLRALYLELAFPGSGNHGPAEKAIAFWDRDRLIAGIRGIEDPPRIKPVSPKFKRNG
jgi:hypothetical protein